MHISFSLLSLLSESYQLPNYDVRNDKQDEQSEETAVTNDKTKTIVASVIGSLAAIALGIAIFLGIRDKLQKRKRSNNKHARVSVSSVSPVDVPNDKV